MLDNPATLCINGVGHRRMEHRATVHATRCTFRVEPASALRTEACTEMILRIAKITMVRQFTRWHVDEPPSSTEDDFEIADNECIFKRDIREAFETLIALLRLSYEPYADFRDLQRRVTLDLGRETVKVMNHVFDLSFWCN